MKEAYTGEVLVLDPGDVSAAIAALAAVGATWMHQPDAIDEDGPTVFATVTGDTELSETELFDLLAGLMSKHGGDVVELGLVRCNEERRAALTGEGQPKDR
jgi:hypothetical protein